MSGATIPGRPAEDDVRLALVEAARALCGLGLNHGSAGNLSVRWHRGGADGLLVTPSALPYERCTPDDVVWMPIVADRASEPRPDGRCRPSSEWRLHHDLYAGRDDVGAVVHTHAPHCTALACLPAVQRDGLPAFHYMVAAAGGADIRCAPYATFGTQALSDHALAGLEGRRACLLAHHGMIAVGATLEAALALAVEVEWLARTYALALSLGAPAVLPSDEMTRVVEKFRDYRP
jgi:L-fuculose-phosphate aldolase